MDSVMAVLAWCLATLIGAFAGSYLGAYMKKKGENLATHEDINKLVDQVRAVTTITKEIEAKISHEFWDRQKRWELKRDALFELMTRLGTLKDKFSDLISSYKTDLENGWQDNFDRNTNRIKIGQNWLDASSAFDNAILIACIVCDEAIKAPLFQFSLTIRGIVSRAQEWDPETLAAGTKPLGKELAAIMDMVRKELDHAQD